MAKDRLHIDYETYNEVSLPDVGTRNYCDNPALEVLMAAYALNDGAVEQWVPAEGEPAPRLLMEMLRDPEVEKWAWNAPFEINVTNAEVCEVDVTQWRDAMVQALHCSLPGALEKAGPVVGLEEDKKKSTKGKALMRKFSWPRVSRRQKDFGSLIRTYWHEKPAEWEEYKDYNRQDVIAERAIMKKLRKFPMPDEEWELWFLDQQINAAGIPVNRAMIENAIKLYEEALGSAQLGTGAFGQMARLTQLDNPNSLPQLLPWLKEHGYIFDDCQKGHIQTARRYFDEQPERWSEDRWDEYKENTDLKEVLDLRLETSRTSIKKYYKFRDTISSDDTINYALQMNGAARTARWGGRLIQPQNLPRPEGEFEEYQAVLADGVWHLDLDTLLMVHDNVFDVLASAIRPTIQAPEGYVFVDADLNAIENRVLGWMARCDKILDVFRLGRDPYISFATYLYGRSYDELWHEYKVLKQKGPRTIAKPGTLGCGYAMGAGEVRENKKNGELEATGLVGYAWNMGVTSFTQEDSKLSVDTFRREFKEVEDFWYAFERAARKCVRTGNRTEHNGIRFELEAPFLKMILPSGRKLYYLRPRIEAVKTPWGEDRMQITYEGKNDRGIWTRINTTPGKLTENADQAISRDLLVHGMKIAARRGIDIRLHVHDQILGLVREDDADRALKVLIESMEEQPWWAEGLPLGAAGHTTKVFIKD